jgi:hypothetical protein
MSIRHTLQLMLIAGILYGCSDDSADSQPAATQASEIQKDMTDEASDLSGDLMDQAKEAASSAVADLKD